MKKINTILIVLTSVLSISVLCISCSEKRNSATLLDETVKEINEIGNEDENKLTSYNSDQYIAVIYHLADIPENKARLLMLAKSPELANEIRQEIFKKLKKGEVLARAIKEGKGLAYGIVSGDLTFQLYYSPEELSQLFTSQK